MALEICAFFCPFKTEQNLFFISIMAKMTFHCNIGSLFIILFKLALKQKQSSKTHRKLFYMQRCAQRAACMQLVLWHYFICSL